MANVKKQYVDLVEFLEANQSKKVSTIMDDIYKMVLSTKRNETVLFDEDNNPIAIFCYYHKQWELLNHVEYGKKASTASGYNTLCKIGASHWSKQQRDAKQAKEEILERVSSGELAPEDIQKALADIEAERTSINAENMPQGYETSEEAMNAYNEEL